MDVIDAKGSKLDEILFIQAYRVAIKHAPARFMSLRLHPDRYNQLADMAEVPESIQVGSTPGPMGRTITRICCVKPLIGINDGVAVIQDAKFDMDKLGFEIHGVPEIMVVNLG